MKTNRIITLFTLALATLLVVACGPKASWNESASTPLPTYSYPTSTPTFSPTPLPPSPTSTPLPTPIPMANSKEIPDDSEITLHSEDGKMITLALSYANSPGFKGLRWLERCNFSGCRINFLDEARIYVYDWQNMTATPVGIEVYRDQETGKMFLEYSADWSEIENSP